MRHARIITRHILPNVMHIVLIAVVMDFSGLVLAEAVLSYVGVGVDPSTNSFGTMINAARLEMAREPMVWWSLAAAFVFMFVLVLAANLFADAVRDGFDPRVRGTAARPSPGAAEHERRTCSKRGSAHRARCEQRASCARSTAWTSRCRAGETLRAASASRAAASRMTALSLMRLLPEAGPRRRRQRPARRHRPARAARSRDARRCAGGAWR